MKIEEIRQLGSDLEVVYLDAGAKKAVFVRMDDVNRLGSLEDALIMAINQNLSIPQVTLEQLKINEGLEFG